MGTILAWLVGAVVGVGLIWGLAFNGLQMQRYFSPKVEAVRRQTFEQSKAYNQGMVQELQNMQFSYAQATDAQKDALASVILHRAADYDENEMPPDLRVFIRDLRRERGGGR